MPMESQTYFGGSVLSGWIREGLEEDAPRRNGQRSLGQIEPEVCVGGNLDADARRAEPAGRRQCGAGTRRRHGVAGADDPPRASFVRAGGQQRVACGECGHRRFRGMEPVGQEEGCGQYGYFSVTPITARMAGTVFQSWKRGSVFHWR